MKSMLKKTWVLLVLGAVALSFSVLPGGEGFEISLNDKIIVKRYGSDMEKVQTLQLNAASSGDKLTIKYYHCGRVGKNKTIIFKDIKGNIIKEIHFADVNNPIAAMTLRVEEILKLKKGNATLGLYYSSSELPSGRMLVKINYGKAGTVMP